MKGLKILQATGSRIGGDLRTFSTLTKLEHLQVFGCGIMGTLGPLHPLTALTLLSLGANYFLGPINNFEAFDQPQNHSPCQK